MLPAALANTAWTLALLIPMALYLAVIGLVAVLAAAHPDRERRTDARRVLSVLLSVWPRRRR